MPARAWTNNSATFDAPNTPILINCRDRVSDLKRLVSWLEEASQERIYLLDNDSEWGPLLEYYEQTPHTVVRLGRNAGSQSIWRLGRVPDEWFVYTDPDLVPIGECPHDLVSRMHELAERYKVPKVGAGLVIDDLPPDHRVLDWERSLVHEDPIPTPGKNSYMLEPGVFSSLVDTTFALYRPSYPFDLAAIRLGYPYQMRHTPWYQTGELSEEDRFYLSRAKAGVGASSWAQERTR